MTRLLKQRKHQKHRLVPCFIVYGYWDFPEEAWWTTLTLLGTAGYPGSMYTLGSGSGGVPGVMVAGVMGGWW